jgi:RimJ/RimL family protein N-acetyltransferase
MIPGDGVRLVPFNRAHMASTRAWSNDPEIARLMDRARPVSEPEHDAWFESVLSRRDCVYFAIEDADTLRHVGNVWLWGIDERHRKAEMRVMLGEGDARGRGLGHQAINLLCRYGFERLNLHRIYAYVLAINPQGRGAFEKAGFVLEGTLREDRWAGDRFIDVYLLARLAPGR